MTAPPPMVADDRPAHAGRATDRTTKVEVGVQVVERWILAVLRYRTFLSLAERDPGIAGEHGAEAGMHRASRRVPRPTFTPSALADPLAPGVPRPSL